jgi:mono/diheme cytochrome c family protein
MKLSHIVVAAVAVGVALSAAPVRAQEAPKGDAASGKKIYLSVGCFECHGRSGQGGAFNKPAPRLAQTKLPFEGFQMQLRNPADDMPAYSEVVMSDQQIADIYAFVKGLPGPRKDISILND